MRASNEAAVLGVEPTWDIAKLFPDQGAWSEEEYLMLPGNRLVEFSHGIVEVLPMPSHAHQLIVVLFIDCFIRFYLRDKMGQFWLRRCALDSGLVSIASQISW